ncbi:MAG TPA: hypothetical protein VL728_19525 [Cyclobacteriaceae bacterium]|jgi:hypothetical protein|nr:hypothetical protein [Cyclobacteriaceae bacterium]
MKRKILITVLLLIAVTVSVLFPIILNAQSPTSVYYLRSRVSDSTTFTAPAGYGAIGYFEQNNSWNYIENGVKKKFKFPSTNYTGQSPTTVTVGGLPAGTAIAGQSISQIIQSIVAPYVNPVFNSFSISGQATTVEVGTTLSGSKTFTWSITPNSGVVPTIDIFDNTASSTLNAGTANDGTQAVTITTIQLNSNGATQSWKGIGNNTSPSGTFNSSNFIATARFVDFFGNTSANSTNSAQVRALPQNVFHTGAITNNLNTGSTNTIFEYACQCTISQVIDLDALNANITTQYILTGTVNVNDAGGTARSTNIYRMTVGSPYSSNHRHQITTN